MTTDPDAAGPRESMPEPSPGQVSVPEPLPGRESVPEPLPGQESEAGAGSPPAPTAQRPPRASQGEAPLYKGEPLEAERGPGLGCFWLQVILLGILLVLTPLTVLWAWDERISAVLLVVTLVLLLFAGQTVIFLLRLVAADRRSRRVPRSATARRTVGMLEDEGSDTDPMTESIGAAQSGQPPEPADPTALERTDR